MEPEVNVVCLKSFRELHSGLVYAGVPGLDTTLPRSLALRLADERIVTIARGADRTEVRKGRE